MLLIDGVKYELWTPRTEDEFETVVKEHVQDIFGEQSIYLDMKQKLKSVSGIGSIPDGFVVIPGNSPIWHIIEMELSSHPLHEHIVSQVSRFITGISNPSIQRRIANAIYEEISKDDFLMLKVKQTIKPNEIYKFLSDLVSKPPTVTIIIEKDTDELVEAISTLAHPEIKVVEFQTFSRESVGLAVHTHLFEPLYKHAVTPLPPLPPPTGNNIEIIIRDSNIKYHYLPVHISQRSLFPSYKVPFKLDTDLGTIETYMSSARGAQIGDSEAGTFFQANLAEWFRQHPTIKMGDKVLVIVVEPMKKYKLEIVK